MRQHWAVSALWLLAHWTNAIPSPPVSDSVQVYGVGAGAGTPFIPADASKIIVASLTPSDPLEIKPAVDVMHLWLTMIRQVWLRPAASSFTTSSSGYWTDDKVKYGRIRLVGIPPSTSLSPQQVGWAGIDFLSTLLDKGQPETTSIPLNYAAIRAAGSSAVIGQFSETFAGPGDLNNKYGQLFNTFQVNRTSSVPQGTPSPPPATSRMRERDDSGNSNNDDWTDGNDGATTDTGNSIPGLKDSNIHLSINLLPQVLAQRPVLILFKDHLQANIWGYPVSQLLSSVYKPNQRFEYESHIDGTFVAMWFDQLDQGGKSATFGDAEQVFRMLLNHPNLRSNPQASSVSAYLTDANGKRFSKPFMWVDMSTGPILKGSGAWVNGTEAVDQGNSTD